MAAGKYDDERSWAALPGPVEVGGGRTAVRLELLPHGRDLVLLIGGGETHVGAVAAADDGSARGRALGSHREGSLAEAAAARVAAAAGCACAVVAGIHQDGATPAEIAAIVTNVETGVAALAAALRGRDRA